MITTKIVVVFYILFCMIQKSHWAMSIWFLILVFVLVYLQMDTCKIVAEVFSKSFLRKFSLLFKFLMRLHSTWVNSRVHSMMVRFSGWFMKLTSVWFMKLTSDLWLGILVSGIFIWYLDKEFALSLFSVLLLDSLDSEIFYVKHCFENCL